MKKFILGMLMGCLLTAAISVFASVGLQDVKIAEDTKLIVLGGEVKTDIVYAVKEDDPNGYGKNYVSARDLAEALGYQVEWNAALNSVEITNISNFDDYDLSYETVQLAEEQAIANALGKYEIVEEQAVWVSEYDLSRTGIAYLEKMEYIKRPDRLMKSSIDGFIGEDNILYEFPDNEEDSLIRRKVENDVTYFYQDDLLKLGILKEPINHLTVK